MSWRLKHRNSRLIEFAITIAVILKISIFHGSPMDFHYLNNFNIKTDFSKFREWLILILYYYSLQSVCMIQLQRLIATTIGLKSKRSVYISIGKHSINFVQINTKEYYMDVGARTRALSSKCEHVCMCVCLCTSCILDKSAKRERYFYVDCGSEIPDDLWPR